MQLILRLKADKPSDLRYRVPADKKVWSLRGSTSMMPVGAQEVSGGFIEASVAKVEFDSP